MEIPRHLSDTAMGISKCSFRRGETFVALQEPRKISFGNSHGQTGVMILAAFTIIASELNTDEHTTTLILEKYISELLSNSEELLNRNL